MKEVEKLKSYIFWHRLSGNRSIFLHVNKFPCLKRYAERVLTLKDKAEYFYLDNMKRAYLTIPFYSIVTLDRFWKKVLRDVGFAYCVSRRAFFFTDFWSKNQVEQCWNRALKFVEELERRGFLDEEKKEKSRNSSLT